MMCKFLSLNIKVIEFRVFTITALLYELAECSRKEEQENFVAYRPNSKRTTFAN